MNFVLVIFIVYLAGNKFHKPSKCVLLKNLPVNQNSQNKHFNILLYMAVKLPTKRHTYHNVLEMITSYKLQHSDPFASYEYIRITIMVFIDMNRINI